MDAIRLDSKIDEVTVYASGALVSRVAELAPAGGGWPERVRLVNLPLALDDRSLRVRIDAGGTAGAGVAPVAADVRVALEAAARDDSLRPAEDASLRAARLDEARLRDRMDHLGRRLAWLERLQPGARPRGRRGEPPPPAPTAARLSLLELRGGSAAQLLEELGGVRAELRRAEERRRDLEERDRRSSSARQAKEHQLRKSAVITLRGPDEAEAVAPVRLRLDYLVPGARWAPAYTLRLDEAMARAELAVRALVCQRTGEDWTGVRLLLSTADALGWFELPEPTSVRIGRQQPPAHKPGLAGAAGVDELYADYDRAMRALATPARGAATTIREQVPVAAADADAEQHAAAFDELTTPFESVVTRSTKAATRDGLLPVPPRGALPALASPAPPMGAPQAPVQSQSVLPLGADDGGMLARSRPKGRNLLGGLFAGGGGVLPSPGEPRTAAAATSTPAEPTWHADDRQLAYPELRMPPAAAAFRGRLVPADRATLYLELVAVQQVTVGFDVLGAIDAAAELARAAGDRAPPAHCAYPSPVTGYDYAYAADAAVDVPSDGDFHSLPLTVGDCDAVLRYVAVPRESTDVFRFAEVMSPLAAPLLDGPIDVYVGGDFLLATDVRFTAPRGRLRLGLGVEQAIKLARNTSYEEEATGLMGGSLALRHEIRVDLENHLPRAASLEIRERMPVAAEGDDDVEIDLGEVSPPWAEYEQEEPLPPLRGGRVWSVTLATGERRQLRAAYVVRIASRNEIVGGNRREG